MWRLLWRRRRHGSAVSSSFGGGLVGSGFFRFSPFLFGSSRLVLRDLLGLFRRDACLLGRLGVGLGLGLRGFLRAFGGEPCSLLFGEPRLFGGGAPGFLRAVLFE